MEFFDSSLPVSIFSTWLLPKAMHVVPPSAGSLTLLAFPLSPHHLVLSTLSQLLQLASSLYLGISCGSHRKLSNAEKAGRGWVLAGSLQGEPELAAEADTEGSGRHRPSGTPE